MQSVCGIKNSGSMYFEHRGCQNVAALFKEFWGWCERMFIRAFAPSGGEIGRCSLVAKNMGSSVWFCVMCPEIVTHPHFASFGLSSRGDSWSSDLEKLHWDRI